MGFLILAQPKRHSDKKFNSGSSASLVPAISSSVRLLTAACKPTLAKWIGAILCLCQNSYAFIELKAEKKIIGVIGLRNVKHFKHCINRLIDQ
jgi:hypothetical protein